MSLKNSIEEITSGLTTDQKNSATHREVNLQIKAGAGSGKTKTLVSLILHEIAHGVEPRQIIVFTFTQKAAGELLTRILSSAQKIFPNVDLDGMYIGTIHGWCLKYLENKRNISNYMILDELHTESLVLRMYDFLGVEAYSGKRYPLGTEVYLGDMDIIWNEGSSRIESEISIEKFHQLKKLLEDNRMLTYGEMIFQSLEILATDENFDTKLVCIDEYQDVNNIQVDLAQVMSKKGARIVGVGDHRQSIYQWRGSNPDRLLQMKDDFPNVLEYKLRHNFRSDKQIVELANQFSLDFLGDSTNDTLIESRDDSKYRRVFELPADNQRKQAIIIADSLLDLHQKGVKWSDCAILMRSLRHGSIEIIEELSNRGIPIGGSGANKGISYVEMVFLPILEWLILASDKKETEEYLNAMELASERLENDLNLESNQLDFWRALNNWLDTILKNSNDSYDLRSGFYRFLNESHFLVDLEDEAATNGIALMSQFMRSIEEIYRRRIPGINRKRVLGILKELKFSIQRDLYSFGETMPVELEKDRVVLSTIHQAKGLEWNVVFLPNLNQGLMPLKNRPRITKIGEKFASSYGTSLLEESRLFYVGITRARELLIVLTNTDAGFKESTFEKSLRTVGIQKCSYQQLKEELSIVDVKNWQEADENFLRLGISDLLMFLECPFEYGLRKRAGIQPAIGQELGFGQGLHEVLRKRIEANHFWDLDLFKSAASQLVWLPYMSESDELKNRERIAQMAYQIQELNLLNEQQKTELNVDLIWGNALVQGTIDGLIEKADGSVIIRDWKSNIHDEFMDRYDKQLLLYAIAVEHKNLTVTAAEYIDVAASAKERAVIKENVDVSNKAQLELHDKVNEAILKISSGKFRATPSKTSCLSCDISSICKYKEDE